MPVPVMVEREGMTVFPSMVQQAASLQSLDPDLVNDAVAGFTAMSRQEGVYCSSDHFVKDPIGGVQFGEHVDRSSREKLCFWCFQLVDYFGFSRETVWIAFSCVDRFLSTPNGQRYLSTKEDFQLATVASLYIAIKIHEAMELDVELIVQMGKGMYTVKQILKTEMDILLGLQWRLNPATPHAFVRRLISLMPTCVSEEHKRRYTAIAAAQLDLATLNYDLATQVKPSIAAASILMNCIDVATSVPETAKVLSNSTIRDLMNLEKSQGDIIRCRRLLLVLIGGGKVIDPNDGPDVCESCCVNGQNRRKSKRGRSSQDCDVRALCA